MIQFVFSPSSRTDPYLISFKENYSDPEIFDGFRYSKMRENEGESTKHGMATLTPDYLTFGQGRHAWYLRIFEHQNMV